MSDTVIKVENLSKAYLLSHQASAGSAERYTALRDVLTNGVKSLGGRFLGHSPLTTHPSPLEEFWALNDVSFEVKQGERVGIIGRNGAGKSTLLKILSRITEPTSGRIRIKGRVASLLEVGTGFHPELTGRENIYLNGAILGMTRAEIRRKFDEIVAFAEVEKFLDTPVKRYSSGMYVRLAFAVAAHLEPEILVVDEVLAVGDAEFQKKCLGKMEEYGSQGRTVLFVSHNVGMIQTLCERAILLKRGSIEKDANVRQVLNHYLLDIEKDAQQDLMNRQDRRGKGKVKFKNIQIQNTTGSQVIVTGKAVKFSFQTTHCQTNIDCIFTLYSQSGYPITNFNSHFYNSQNNKIGSTCQFECLVDELMLLPGRYRLNAMLVQDGELQDHVEAAAFFEVEASAIQERHIGTESGFGSVYIPHQWILPAQT